MDNQECYFCYICANSADFVCQCDVYMNFLCEEHFNIHIQKKDLNHKVYRLEEVLKCNPASADCRKRLDVVCMNLRYYQELTNLYITNLTTFRNLLLSNVKDVFGEAKDEISRSIARIKNLKTLIGSGNQSKTEVSDVFCSLSTANLHEFLNYEQFSNEKIQNSLSNLQDSIPPKVLEQMYSNAVKQNPYKVFNEKSKNAKKQFWDMIKIKQLAIFEGHTHPVHSLALSGDNKLLISGGADCTIRIWDLSRKRQIQELRHKNKVNCVVLTKDDKYFLSCSCDRKIKLWELGTWRKLATYIGHTDNVQSLAVTSNSKYFVSGDEDGYIFVWSLPQVRILAVMRSHDGGVNTLAMMNDNKRFVSAGSDSLIRIWSMKCAKVLVVLSGHNDSVNSIALTVDNRYIISASGDCSIRIFNLEHNRQEGILLGHGSPVLSVVVSSDSRYIVSGGTDKTVRFWSMKDRKIEGALRGYINNIYCLAISQDSRYIISGVGYEWFGMDNLVRVWHFYE
jgi:WD40 repeat protein